MLKLQQPTVVEGQDFSLCGKPVVAEANLRDEYYWKLVADFIGPQSGEGLGLDEAPCKNRLLVQVGLMREDNNFPWIAVIEWLRKIFSRHNTADFRRLIERGVATTQSLESEARLAFMESGVNFDFVGPICDSIGVERTHLLQMKDFSEQAKSIEVTNGLILELSNFAAREKIAPIILVSWLRIFNPEYCKKGKLQKAYVILRAKIKKLKMCCRNYETRSHRRNAVMESFLQTPFELVRKKTPRFLAKKRIRKDDMGNYEKVTIKEEYESLNIMQGETHEMNRCVIKKVILKEHVSLSRRSDEDMEASSSGEEIDDTDVKEESFTLFDIAMLSLKKLAGVYGGKTAVCKKVAFELLTNHYNLTCRENPAMEEFEKKVNSLSDEVNLASPLVFLNCNSNFLVDVHDALEQYIMTFEEEIIRTKKEKLGRDKLPKFRNFVNLKESATSRYINMACDILGGQIPDMQNYRKHWVAFCQEKKNPSKLTINQRNPFNSYFENAAGLIHHHKETAPFLSDLLSLNSDQNTNIILESVAADAGDSVIQSLVCVLALIYCKILGPYWQLLQSGGEYSHFSRLLLCLYQKFLDWSKEPSTLLEPEENMNVFQQFPLQEKTFEGVFHYCGQWHVNREMIRACLKRTIKVIAGVTEEHLKDFLPGGKLSTAPSPELSLELAGCTFSVLMADYPYSDLYPHKTKKRSRSPKRHSSDSSQEDDGSGSGDDSESSGEKKREKAVVVRQEEVEENMNGDYIIAMVRKNGGPCKTQQDVDKMMLRFDGKPRAEKREAVRCEILYQKMILNNTNPNLDCMFRNTTEMVIKLKLALPRIKPGYSLVLAPKMTKIKPVIKELVAPKNGPEENGNM